MNKTVTFDSFPEAIAAAKAALRSGDVKGAAAIYRQLPVQFPQKKQASTVAAEGLDACGQWVEGVEILEAARRAAPTSALILSALAESYRKIGNDARAAEYMQLYLEYDSRSPDAWLKFALLHDRAGNPAAAETAYASALERDPTSALAAIGRGDALAQLGRPKDAADSYRRAITIEPKNPSALFALGSLLMTQGQYVESHEYLRRSLEIDPGNARAHVNLGLAYLHSGNAKDAAAAARNALIVDNDLQIGRVLLGMALGEEGDLDGAGSALALATALNNHSNEALFLLAAVQTARGDKTGAELALQRILSAESHNLEARHLLAALHSEAVSAPPQGYAREAFDRIAPQYDTQETRRQYQAPAEIAALIESHEPERSTIARIADAGCGTGLVLTALRDAFVVEYAVGIDLSPSMIAAAGEKDLYDDLIVGEAVSSLSALEGTFDLITAADLFAHLGNLTAFMTAARARMATGGLLAYAIEMAPGEDGATLAPSGRFLHSQTYIETTAQAVGLKPVAARPIVLRRLFGRDVPGLIGLLQA